MKELITVFMPVYNAEKYLKESISSILEQTYSNLELLIIDDGSTDNSVSIIKSFKDNRIKLFFNKENKGLPYTRNKGLSLANGDYFAIMDADDICRVNRLEKEIEFLKKNLDYDIVGSRNDFLCDKTLIRDKYKKWGFEHVNLETLYFCPLLNSSAMIRMSFIKKYDIRYNPEYFVGQDYAFWSECSKYTKIARLNDSLIIYRTGHENITKISTQEKSKVRKLIIDKIRINNWRLVTDKLGDEEINIINKVFSDPKIEISEQDIESFSLILKNVLKESEIEEKKALAMITRKAITNKIVELKIGKIKKIKLMNCKLPNESLKSFLLAYVKLIYKILI